jgi:ACT domain.
MSTSPVPLEVGRYVAYVRAVDRPGSMTAVAEVVGSRGLSMDSLASGDVRDGTAVVILSFTASERLRRLVERTLARLAVVSSVEVLPADDPSVRASGIIQAGPGTRFRPPPDAAVSWSGETESGQPLLIAGQLLEVEKVLRAARDAGITSMSYALLPPAPLG